jgi:hypothetical protein
MKYNKLISLFYLLLISSFANSQTILLKEFITLKTSNISQSSIIKKGYTLNNKTLIGKFNDTIKVKPNSVEWLSPNTFCYECNETYISIRKQINQSDFIYSRTFLKSLDKKKYIISEHYYENGGVGSTFEVYTIYQDDTILSMGIIFNKSAEGEH